MVRLRRAEDSLSLGRHRRAPERTDSPARDVEVEAAETKVAGAGLRDRRVRGPDAIQEGGAETGCDPVRRRRRDRRMGRCVDEPCSAEVEARDAPACPESRSAEL